MKGYKDIDFSFSKVYQEVGIKIINLSFTDKTYKWIPMKNYKNKTLKRMS